MNECEIRHYRKRLLELRTRVTSEMPRLAETVLTDARAPGEHDAAVSESSDKELVLELAGGRYPPPGDAGPSAH